MEQNTMESISSEEQQKIIKNLWYDTDTGRFILTDNQNISYLCDMFGRQKHLFKKRITGISNRYQRKKKLQPLLIKTSTIEDKKIISPLKSQEKPINSKYYNFNTISNEKSINYHPFKRKFDDGCGMPKSLVIPFFNENMGDKKEKDKKELIEHLDMYFSNEVCKNNISLNYHDNKAGLSYLTCDLNDYKLFEEDNKFILKLIDNTIKTYREQYKNKLNILYKNPVVKALTKFKKYILSNRDIKIVNGCRLNDPPEEIKEKYGIISHNIKSYFDNIREKNKFHDKIIEYYKNRKYKTINEIKANEENDENIMRDTQMNNIIVGPDKLNNICKSKDFTIGRLLEMDFGFTEEDHKNKLNRIKRLGNSAFRTRNNKNIIKNKHMKLFSGLRLNKNKSNILKKLEDERDSSKVEVTCKETLETLSNNNKNLNDIYVNNNNKEKSLEQKIADNELSFISELSEREQKIQNKRLFRIKSVNDQRLQTDVENKLLNGFCRKEELEIDEKMNNNKKEHKLKNMLDSYKNDMDLLKITNPTAYEMQKKMEMHDYMLMKKKIELNTFLEKNQKIYKNQKSDKKIIE